MTTFTPIDLAGFSKIISNLDKENTIKRESVVAGIGQNASLTKTDPNHLSLHSTSLFLEGIHFDLTYSPLHTLGYKIVTSVVSDLYAMNAEPVQLQLCIGLPNRISIEMAEQFFLGIHEACRRYSIELTKAEPTASHQGLAISASVSGTVPEKEVLQKVGATEGELICVTGDLGSAVAGLRVLMREKKQWQQEEDNHFQPDLEGYDYVIKRQLKPEARTEIKEAFREAKFLPSSLTQVKQGLVTDLKSLLISSGISAEIYSPAIPITLDTRKIADEMNEDVDKYAFYGGEDFELLFTLPEKDEPRLRKVFDDFVVIGKTTKYDGALRINTGEETILMELD
ncbi:MAG: thiamine-phosphate kinase [Balneolaceae bacterium]|nr:MAG: thiamine-phosphate kinase [Balneolaceae bacterium]